MGSDFAASAKGLEVQVHHIISLGGWNNVISIYCPQNTCYSLTWLHTRNGFHMPVNIPGIDNIIHERHR
jgi:hypothetical protein